MAVAPKKSTTVKTDVSNEKINKVHVGILSAFTLIGALGGYRLGVSSEQSAIEKDNLLVPKSNVTVGLIKAGVTTEFDFVVKLEQSRKAIEAQQIKQNQETIMREGLGLTQEDELPGYRNSKPTFFASAKEETFAEKIVARAKSTVNKFTTKKLD